MRLFVCQTVIAPDYKALTYKEHCIAIKYKNGDLKVVGASYLSSYVLENLINFMIKHCHYEHKQMGFPCGEESFKKALTEAFKSGLIKQMDY